MNKRVLVVDDQEEMCTLVQVGLSKHGCGVDSCAGGDEAIEQLGLRDYDVVITDLKLANMSGLALCEWIAANRPYTPVIVITAFGNMQSAIAAMRVGAYDFINKPIDIEALAFAVERASRHRELGREVRRLRKAVSETEEFSDMVGESGPVRRVYDLIARIGESDSTVLITGESGTGKELVARALHARTPRRTKPFVAINCAAMPPTLLESELFGHVRGAFTDAKQAHQGLFVQADGGTLFLDEIGEMPLEMQPKLLRTLEEGKVRPVGSNREVAFDVRIIAATNRDLQSDVEDGRFREDLFYRINVIEIHMPPLRSRGNDTLLLAQYFIKSASKRCGKEVMSLSESAAEKLLDYDWPGNVRELENCIERAVTLTRFERVMVEDLPEKVRKYRSSDLVIAADDPEQLLPLEELERRYIRRVLKAVDGNKSQAARVLGLDRRTLYRKLERYERLAPPDPT